MDKRKKQTVLNIVELLKKEEGSERIKEYENQLLGMLGEQDRDEMAEVLDGRKLPSLLSECGRRAEEIGSLIFKYSGRPACGADEGQPERI